MATHEKQPEAERTFGRDGVSGLIRGDRAMRAREVSRPTPADIAAAAAAAPRLIAQGTGKRRG